MLCVPGCRPVERRLFVSINPFHAKHVWEKGFTETNRHRYTVHSQERRALALSLTNRGSTAGQMRVNRWFRSSIGLHRMSFVRSSEDTSRTNSAYDSLEGKREGCFLAGSTRRRPVLPSPAPSRRPAERRPDPTGPYCVRVLDSTAKEFRLLVLCD